MFGLRKTVASAPSLEPELDIEAVDLPAAGVFLGSLRSEIDEPDELPAAFDQLATVAESIISAYRRHALSDEDAATRLHLLRLRDNDAIEWTVGPTSRRWYRKLPGGTWKAAVPPSHADDTVVSTSRAAIEQLAAMPSISTTFAAQQPTPAADTLSGAATDLALEEAPEWATADVDGDVTDADAQAAFGEDEVEVDDGSATRDWSFEQPAAADPDVPVVVAGDEPAAAAPRLSIPALPAITPGAAEEATYGYGDDTGAPSEFAVDDETSPAAEPGNQGAGVVVGAGTNTTAPGKSDPANTEQDAELRSMLAALSQDTGITLTGFDN